MKLDDIYRSGAYTLKTLFGKNYIGPNILPHAKKVLIAKLSCINSPNPVLVYAIAWPSIFYEIKFGKIKIETGTISAQLCHEIANGIANDMIGIEVEDD